MEGNINTRGGKRTGAGRPKGDRTNILFVRLNDTAYNYVKQQKNASKFIEDLIYQCIGRYNEK